MWEILKNLKELLSLDIRQIFILAGISWGLIAVPSNIWKAFGLINITNQFQPFVFIVAVIATMWLVFGVIFNAGKTGLTKWTEPRRMKRSREEIMLSTSKDERQVLAKYIADNTTTLAFDMRDGVVNSLRYKGVLYRASKATNPMSYDIDTNLQPWASDYLESHPIILEGIDPRIVGRHQMRR